MLRKKEAYTVVTPIPSFIPRQLALDILHAHSEVITLNPLVLEHKPIPAPRTAASDEYYSTWYEITERIQFVPGVGRLGSSKITFNGCFHDMPWGLQTHIYAPMNVDLRNRYRIGGNQPGEPPETREIGLETPADGLYLREDIEIRCNITMITFVKSELKAASKEMISRMIKKAELLDAGILQAMMLDGRLKTINPNDRTQTGLDRTQTGLQSPALTSASTSPRLSLQQQHASYSSYGPRPGTAGSHYSTNPASPKPYMYHQQQQQHPQQQQQYPPPQFVAELPSKDSLQPQSFPMELPGDYHHTQPPPPPPPATQQQAARYPGEPRWSPQPQSSPKPSADYRNSVSSIGSSGAPYPSPGFPPQGYGQGYSAELPSHRETAEEYYRR